MKTAIFLIGRSGAGKGTQAELLAKRGFFIISTGDLIRKEAQKDTDLGRRCKQILEEGRFAHPDDIQELIGTFIRRTRRRKLVFEGSPRTAQEARFLYDTLTRRGYATIPVWLDVSRKECARRLLERKREDDTPKLIKRRMAEFRERAKAIFSVKKPAHVEGWGFPHDIHNKILEAVEDYDPPESNGRGEGLYFKKHTN